jgi:hypothetical protein
MDSSCENASSNTRGGARLEVLVNGHHLSAIPQNQRRRVLIDLVYEKPVPLAHVPLARCGWRIVATSHRLEFALQYRIGIGCNDRAGRIETGQADVAVERIGSCRRHIFDIVASAGRVVDGYLHRRVRDDRISTDGVALDSCSYEDPICISQDVILFDCVIGIGRGYQADSEVVPLSLVAISADPVRTEPVVTGTSQSYPAAWSAQVAIANRDVIFQYAQ